MGGSLHPGGSGKGRRKRRQPERLPLASPRAKQAMQMTRPYARHTGARMHDARTEGKPLVRR